jgi:periplasmic divalent cation tolerance protein
MIIVFTSTPNSTEAQSLAEKIVSAKLAACVQVLPQITSVYMWEGKMQNETESLLLIKTIPDKYEALEDFIIANHSYAVPEIVAVDAERVSEPYLQWMDDLLR